MPLHNKTRELDRDVVHHGQVGKPEQLGSTVLQQNVHSSMFRIAPDVLHGASHTGKLALLTGPRFLYQPL